MPEKKYLNLEEFFKQYITKKKLSDYIPVFYKISPSIFSYCPLLQLYYFIYYQVVKSRKAESEFLLGLMNDGEYIHKMVEDFLREAQLENAKVLAIEKYFMIKPNNLKNLIVTFKPDAIIEFETEEGKALGIIEIKSVSKDSLPLEPKVEHVRQLAFYVNLLTTLPSYQAYEKIYGIIWYFLKKNSIVSKTFWFTREELEPFVQYNRQWMEKIDQFIGKYLTESFPVEEEISQLFKDFKPEEEKCRNCIFKDKCFLQKKKNGKH